MLKKILSILAPIVLFIVLSLTYSAPVLSGKGLIMHDQKMSKGAAHESMEFFKETGEITWWSNSMFGGMPGFMIFQKYPNSLITKIGDVINQSLPSPAIFIFLLMVGFYILMVTLKMNRWIAIAASVGYAFGTFNLLFLEAGHVSKILALAYAPGVIAGFVLIFRNKYVLGTAVTALFLAFEIFSSHLQITYYLFFVLLGYTIYELILKIRQGELNNLPKIALCFVIALIIGIGSNTVRLWNGIVYSAETTRGKSELTKTDAGKNGLDREYAFGWSYGVDETITLLVPNLMGGGSSGPLSIKSEVYKSLVSGGVPANSAVSVVQNMPLYFGNQPVTSGPSYSGIVLIFLFVLGMILLKSKGKWVLISGLIVFIMLAWGKNFAAFNNIIFDYLPGYNKFRDVKMILTIVHLLIAIGAAFGLKELFKKDLEYRTIRKPIYISIGIIFLLMLIGYFSVNFRGPKDEQFKSNFAQSIGPDFAQRVLLALQEDRNTLALNDVYRGIFFLVITLLLIWLYKSQKIKENLFGILMVFLILIDLFIVDKRYFNNSDFVSKYQMNQEFEPSPANQQILLDKDPNFRVLNTTVDFMNDATDSYYHKSIGGYHGAKLKRTQELISNQLIKDGRINLPIVNMLNTKYIIVGDAAGMPTAQLNPEAMGNAWFIKDLKIVANADEEMAALDSLDIKNVAVMDKRFDANVTDKIYQTDSSAKISLTSYKPNELKYQSSNNQKGLAVFSEMYYRGNVDWISKIDGKVVPHVRVNYVLRAIEIPAGKHEITFEFKPVTSEKGKLVDLIASVGLVLLLGFAGYHEFKRS